MTAWNGWQKNIALGVELMSAKVKENKPKTKSLFDHVNEIRIGKNPKYFETLSDEDKKTWSNYMVCRVLSMQSGSVDMINDLQYYQDKLAPEQFYQVCIAVIPKKKVFAPYVKRGTEKYKPELLHLLASHFKDSWRNVYEYISLLTKDDLKSIIRQYGYSEKQIEDLIES
jgi:hypothetical protein